MKIVFTTVNGMRMPLATIEIVPLNEIAKAKTKRVCPNCGQEPEWHGGYECTCCPKCGKPMKKVTANDEEQFCPKCGKPMEKVITGENGKEQISWKCAEDGFQDPQAGWRCDVDGFQDPPRYGHWSQLKEVLPDGTEVKKERLIPKDTDVEAEAYVMPIAEFAKKATQVNKHFGVNTKDMPSMKNLINLLIAHHNLGQVIVIAYKDTYEECRAVLTTLPDETVVLMDIIPDNLSIEREVMKMSYENLSEPAIKEAELFVKMMKAPPENIFTVSDYRTIGLGQKQVSPKVQELHQAMQQAMTIAVKTTTKKNK